MRAHNRYANTSSAHLDIRVHDLTGLVIHLHLLFRIAIFREYVYVRDYVICQLISEFLYCRLLAL